MYPQTLHHDEVHSLYNPGDIVQANYAFKKDKYEDLPFMQNDRLEIISVAKDPNWAHARNVSGETGLIPLNYVRSAVITATDLTIHRQMLDACPSSMKCTSSVIKYSLDEYDWFPNLPDLIKYYSVPDSGLVAALLYPVVDLQRKRLNRLKNGGWIIPRCELTLGENIGRGEFGEVHKATYKNKQVAVKIYKKTACKLAITYEASLMSKISHQNVVALVGLVYEPDDAVYVLTEYIANGSLLTYLHSRTRNEICQLTKLQFTIDACLGLEHLARCRIIHRDIAARNILLSEQANRLTAKVADFGMARHLDEPIPTGNPSGRLPPPMLSNSSSLSVRYPTRLSDPIDYVVLHDNAAIPVKWTAPEAVRDRLFSSKSDVWSFGILMWEIYSYGRIPYPRLMAHQVTRQLATGYRMKSPEDCPAVVYGLMTRMWRLNPDERPDFSSILIDLLELRQDPSSIQGIVEPEPTAQHQPRAFTLPRRTEGDRNSSWERNECLEYGWTDSITEPIHTSRDIWESDCYDCMEEEPSQTAVADTTMARSFTNTSTASPRGTLPNSVALESTRRTVFCLPKFERFQL